MKNNRSIDLTIDRECERSVADDVVVKAVYRKAKMKSNRNEHMVGFNRGDPVVVMMVGDDDLCDIPAAGSKGRVVAVRDDIALVHVRIRSGRDTDNFFLFIPGRYSVAHYHVGIEPSKIIITCSFDAPVWSMDVSDDWAELMSGDDRKMFEEDKARREAWYEENSHVCKQD